MARFEVFLPAAAPAQPVDLTLRVDADNWLAALKAGMQKMGGGQMATNILCDIKPDNSIHVTDPGSGRVFRIREVDPADEVTEPAGRVALVAPTQSELRRSARHEDVTDVAVAPFGGKQPASMDDRIRQARRASSIANAVVEIPEPSDSPPKQIGRKKSELVEEALDDLFARVEKLSNMKKADEGLGFLLDLAMQKIESESGAAFVADLSKGDLKFSVARGPKASEVMKLKTAVPIGIGIVGFCAQENVCLAVSDAQKDARFHRAVSDAVGYETKSILCAPIASGDKVMGALEIINRKGSSHFEKSELAILTYLAHRAAEFLARLG